MAQALPMVRTGYCSRCGECCTPDPSENGNPLFTDEERGAAGRVNGYCPMFRWKNGRGFCLGHGWHPYWLAGCHGYPWAPQDLDPAVIPSCTFRFEAA